MSSNTFGIEIECYLPEGGTAAEAAAAVTRRGALTVAETYTHQVREHWKIVTDGSLGDYSRGIELVSPILRGPEGMEAVTKVLDALNDYGCTVSRRCGLHVHVGVGMASMAFFRNIYKLYASYEPVIDRFMPPSRRESANIYCRSVTTLAFSEIDRAPDLDTLLRLMSGHGGSGARYFKLNLAAYRSYRTVEFRQHSGTLDPSKVNNWVLFCLRMVEAAQAGRLGMNGAAASVDATSPRPQFNRARYGSKTWQVGQMCLRPGGVTMEEALAATGWRQMSMPPVLRACGLGFTTQRIGRTLRYFAQAAAASVAIAGATPTLDGLLDLLQCEDSEKQYFRLRTANLSGTVQWAA